MRVFHVKRFRAALGLGPEWPSAFGASLPAAAVPEARGRAWTQNGPRSAGAVLSSGANERTRTADLRITSALLYQLSHVGVVLLSKRKRSIANRPVACKAAACGNAPLLLRAAPGSRSGVLPQFRSRPSAPPAPLRLALSFRLRSPARLPLRSVPLRPSRPRHAFASPACLRALFPPPAPLLWAADCFRSLLL